MTGNVTQAIPRKSGASRAHSERILEIDRELMPDVIEVPHHGRERWQLRCNEKCMTEEPQYECRPQCHWMIRNERPELSRGSRPFDSLAGFYSVDDEAVPGSNS